MNDANPRLRPSPRERVELFEEERIVPRGVAETRWLVRVRHGWSAASQVPGARTEKLASGPGVVWTRRVELELGRGTLLQCVRTVPRRVDLSPLGFLESSRSTSRRVLRTLHRVGQGGRVTRVSPRGP